MKVDRIAEQLETLAPEHALETVLAANQSKHLCLTTSFQAEGLVVAHLLRKRVPEVPVLFLDTGYHFQQTYEYRDRMTRQWSLNLVNVLPSQTVRLELGASVAVRERERNPASTAVRRRVSGHRMPAVHRFTI